MSTQITTAASVIISLSAVLNKLGAIKGTKDLLKSR